MDDSHRSLGAAIAEARIAAGITQEELGHLAGLGQSVVSRIEAGLRKVEALELVAIAATLGINLSELVATSEEPVVLALRIASDNQGVGDALAWVNDFLARVHHLEEAD
jgi:transcriptional regulator with XRE-family HTH domain